MIWEFNREGTDTGVWKQVEMNLSGEINTWAVFWAAAIYLQRGLPLTPCKSIVRNIGFDGSGENCGSSPWFRIAESINHQIINFPSAIESNENEFKKDKSYFRRITHTHKVLLDSFRLLLVQSFPTLCVKQ